MKNKKSKIVISGIIIATLGFLWYGICRKKKSSEKEGSRETTSMVSECSTDDTKDKINKESTSTDLYESESAEVLLYQVLKSALTEGSFESLSDLVDIAVSRFTISAQNIDWYSELPTSIDGFELFIKQHGLYGLYVDVMKNKNKDRI